MTAWMLAGAALGYLIGGWTGAAIGTLIAGAIGLFWPMSFYVLGVAIIVAGSITLLVAVLVIASGKPVEAVLSRLVQPGIALLLIGVSFGLGALVSTSLEGIGWQRLAARAAAGTCAGVAFGLLAFIVGGLGIFPASGNRIGLTATEFAHTLMGGAVVGVIVGAFWTLLDTVPRILQLSSRFAGRIVGRAIARRLHHRGE